jgi:cyclopropane-fatty-acyl-phospholipid synthase
MPLHDKASTRSIDTEQAPVFAALANALRRQIVRRLEAGRLLIDTPGGRSYALDSGRPGPQARLTVHRWSLLRRLLTGRDIGLAEAYMAGDWSSPDLPRLLEFARRNSRVAASWANILPLLLARLRHALNRNTRRGSRRNIAAHYDLGNDFYAQWLDAGMTYSSALYTSPGQTLEDAQRTKLDRAIDLLALSGGERVLEIGCGWGSLAERLIGWHDCTVTGLTLSTEQLGYAQRRLADRGRHDKGEFLLQDYRDLRGSFDRVVSIEMLEAVGEAYWPTFFAKLRESLRPRGIAVLQVITIDESEFEQYRSSPEFIQRYIFPGGMLPTCGIVEDEIARAGLQLVSTEFFADSYARTLAEWQRSFQKAWPAIQGLGFDAHFKRMWEYYLDYCQVGFTDGVLNVGLYQITNPDHEPRWSANRGSCGALTPPLTNATARPAHSGSLRDPL